MKKIIFISTLGCLYVGYSAWVYTQGTDCKTIMSASAVEGKKLWQLNNCQTCHQLYGLGGYMGPDLTTITTDKYRGSIYAKAMLLSGGARMPNFRFTENNAADIVEYLSYVNNTTATLTK
jgi:nitric oxide reductase subunit C